MLVIFTERVMGLRTAFLCWVLVCSRYIGGILILGRQMMQCFTMLWVVNILDFLNFFFCYFWPFMVVLAFLVVLFLCTSFLLIRRLKVSYDVGAKDVLA